MGRDEGAPFVLAAGGVDRGDEHAPQSGAPAAAAQAPRVQPAADPELVHGLGPVALVVHLAVGRPPDGGHDPHAPGRLVRGQLLLHVLDQLGLGGELGGVGVQLDHRHDLLAVGRVRDTHHDGVAHRVVRLERLLDLLGEDLLAARVDADRPPAEQVDGAVGVHLREVARDGVAHPVDLLERAVRLLLVLVVAERVAPAQGEHAHLVRTRAPPAGRPRSSTFTSGPRVNDAVLAAAPLAETDTPMPSASDELKASTRSMPGWWASNRLLHRLAPHGPRRNDHHERAQVPLARMRVERGQQRARERVAHDDQPVHLLALDGVEHLHRVVLARLEQADPAALGQHGVGRGSCRSRA